MLRSVITVVTGVVLAFAEPAFAQQTPTCDGPQDACQQLMDLTTKYNAAWNKNHATSLAALFTQDAVIVGEIPTVFGREACERAMGDFFKGGGWSNHSVDVLQVHVIGDLA